MRPLYTKTISITLRSALLRSLVLGVLAVSVTQANCDAASANASCSSDSHPTRIPYRFDCRAYELVSPAYKEGFQLTVEGISGDGSRLLAMSLGTLSNNPLGGNALYELMRGPSGWEATAEPVSAPFSDFPIYSAEGVSPDFQNTLVFASTPKNYTQAVYLRQAGDSAMLVGPSESPTEGERFIIVGASESLHRAVFVAHSPNNGSLERNPLWPGDTTAGGRLPSLYEYEYAGVEAMEPRLVGIENEGVPANIEASHLIGHCGTYLGSLPEAEGDMYNAVSMGGAAVFFTVASSSSCGESGPPTNELYARFASTSTMPAHTVALSEPSLSVPGRLCTGACAEEESNPGSNREGSFAGASLDGSKVFFMTAQSLVNGDEGGAGTGLDVYEADIAEGAITRLVQVSRGGTGDATPGSGARLMGVARVSEDGSHVYFVAEGRLTGEPRGGGCLAGLSPAELTEEEATHEGRCRPKIEADNLYVYDTVTGKTSFVATLASANSADWSPRDHRPVQATPDGGFLVFQSVATLTPDQEGRSDAGQVFEYDAATEGLVRVSQGREGYNEDGNSSVYSTSIPVQEYVRELPPIGLGRFTGLAVSADGSRVFFSSRDSLTPQALNGALNIYEYHDGRVDLISDGHDMASTEGHPASALLGTDESGNDVFFTTADRLVPQDTNEEVDVYDARIEGGFAPPSPLVPCQEDSCQAPPSLSPTLLVPAVSSAGGELPMSSAVPEGVSAKEKPGKRKRKADSRRKKRQKRKGRSTRKGQRATGRRR